MKGTPSDEYSKVLLSRKNYIAACLKPSKIELMYWSSKREAFAVPQTHLQKYDTGKFRGKHNE